MNSILEWLKLPQNEGIKNLNDPAATIRHAEIIRNKKILRNIYIDFYNQFRKSLDQSSLDGVVVELGSGGGFIQEVIPNVRRSDILQIPTIDLCFSAERVPFKSNSVDAFLMIDVFHHIKEPVLLIKEFERCLKKNGRIVMIEPANTLWGRFVYSNFHHENFNPKAGWSIEGHGPMSDANGALPWIIFCRDRKMFKSQFDNIQLEKVAFHTPFCYLVSGGLSMRQLLPSFMYPLVRGFEILLTPFNPLFGMFMTIHLRKLI